MLSGIAFSYIDLGDRDKALSRATEALPLAKVARNDQLIGRVLDCIGEVHNNFSDKQAAIDYYKQALPLLQASGDRAGYAQAHNNLGVAYLGMGEKRKALELFQESMRILDRSHSVDPLGDRHGAPAAERLLGMGVNGAILARFYCAWGCFRYFGPS